MSDFFVNNFGTVIVGVLVLALLVFAAIKLISDRKKGKTSCGCGCSECPNAGLCHAQKKDGR